VDAGETTQNAGIATVTAGERELGKELGNPLIENRTIVAAGLVTQGTSKPAAGHQIYPYLLGGLAIERVSQVWCSDVTYIPIAKGFLYLVVIMDWVSRAVLA
jgi:transposase InsO family protein